MRPKIVVATLAVTICLCAAVRAAEPPVVIELWPEKVPGGSAPIGEEKMTGEKGSRALTNVSRPTITVYRPAKENDTGVTMLIAPGGGYSFLAWDHEGEDVAAWLNSIGVTGVLLKYRVPRRADQPREGVNFGPLQDAQRALSLVRSKAKEWGIDPDRIGMVGFSAGGHLTALTATNFDARAYEPIDETDRVSCRPDFAVIVYPGGMIPRGGDTLTPGVRVTKETPPAFFVHCSDDRGTSENSVLMYLAMKRAGVPAELHVYAVGGHGFGLRPSKNPAAQRPKRCEEWLRSQGILKAPSKS
ncbi:MAG TPA: alpha/beta hydrolase [Isosphaeraceae bacterium]|jgi:acetyl esterase/lipase|nr:alpha/beta hydrolase [Isosphaeraceae bacterium]